MNPATLINIAALGFALLILWRAEPALARMGSATHWLIRYAMLLLAGGAIGTILTIYAGGSIDPLTLLILAGIALFLACERRIGNLINLRSKGGRHA